jgi:hypothetical protein
MPSRLYLSQVYVNRLEPYDSVVASLSADSPLSRRLARLGVALLILGPMAFAYVMWSRTGEGLIADDYYAWFYPNTVRAWESFWQGRGVLWNPYQDCGQPLFAITQSAFLYPFNVFLPGATITAVTALALVGFLAFGRRRRLS